MFYFLCKANKKVSSVTMMEASCCHANKEQVLSSVLSFLCVFSPFSLDGDRFCSTEVLYKTEGRAKT